MIFIFKDFSKQQLPKKYIKNGKECYLDPIRKRLTYVTPEETVRQQIISYLINELKVPKVMIRCEETLSHYGVDSRNRADIIVHRMENDALVPLAVIECKAPDIFLGEKEANQLTGYANELSCDYLQISNGSESFFYHYDEQKEQYLMIEKFPTYAKMLNSSFQLSDIETIPERIPFSQLEEFIKECRAVGDYIDIGENTPINKAVMSLNLWEAILDVRMKMPIRKYSLFETIEDLGVRLLSYGNASGGVFSGPYRSFLIDFQGNNQIVSFGMSTYCTWAKQDIKKTALNVAIDTDKSAHHSLQLIIDDNVVSRDGEFSFYHHGKIAIGNKGSGKISELRSLVEKISPNLICGDKFYLGTLKNDRLLALTDTSVTSLIENLISYALIRDTFRSQVKQKS